MNMKLLKTSLAPGKPNQTGFTLMELLVVVSIITFLAAVSIPSISSLSKSGNFSNDVQKIADLANQARTIARAENTYVWMGFYQQISPNNNQDVYIVLLKSQNGQESDFEPVNNKWLPAGRPVSCHKMIMDDSYNHIASAIPAMQNITSRANTKNAFDGDSGFSSASGIDVPVNGNLVRFNNFISFHPDGSVTSPGTTSGSPSWIILPLLQQNSKNNLNAASLEIAGLTGKITIYQP